MEGFIFRVKLVVLLVNFILGFGFRVELKGRLGLFFFWFGLFFFSDFEGLELVGRVGG